MISKNRAVTVIIAAFFYAGKNLSVISEIRESPKNA